MSFSADLVEQIERALVNPGGSINYQAIYFQPKRTPMIRTFLRSLICRLRSGEKKTGNAFVPVRSGTCGRRSLRRRRCARRPQYMEGGCASEALSRPRQNVDRETSLVLFRPLYRSEVVTDVPSFFFVWGLQHLRLRFSNETRFWSDVFGGCHRAWVFTKRGLVSFGFP